MHELELQPTVAGALPHLGWPDGGVTGPCLVVKRVEEGVSSPLDRARLQREVEQGQSLDNADAAKVYARGRFRGPGGLAREVEVTPHAQYRMDLRGVVVSEVGAALAEFQRKLSSWRSKGDARATTFARRLTAGDAVEFLYEKLGLSLSFVRAEAGVVRLITVYWKGQSDPRPRVCEVPHSHEHGE